MFTCGEVVGFRKGLREAGDTLCVLKYDVIFLFCFSPFAGGRMRYRGSGSNANNPNLMYQDECDRRMRSVGGSSKDSRGNSSNFGRSGGGGRDSDRSSSSYRDRGRDGRSGGYNDQYQSYGSSGGGGQYGSRGGGGGSQSGGGGGGGGGQEPTGPPQGHFGQPPPPPAQGGGGPQPLMAQQFPPPPQPMMGFMAQGPFPFGPPPPPPPPPPRK